MDLPYERRFHFRDGSSAGSLAELRAKLEEISYQEFYHHVNAEKNDFASWVRHVLHETQLADDLQRVTSIVETVEIIGDYLSPRAVPQQQDVQARIEQELHITPPVAVTQELPPTPVEPPQQSHPAAHIDFTALEQSMSSGSGTSRDDVVMSVHERKMLIVKDFIIGLFLGMFIGIVLGRMMSF